MDMNNLPGCPFELRAHIFAESASEVIKLSVPFARDEYHQNDLLVDCIYFVMDNLLDTARSDFDSLGRVWLFPVTETHGELELALTACLTGMYKSVYDHLRRALEITVVGCYFLMEHISETDAKAWLKSENETPPFSRAIRGLEKNYRFAGLESSSGWLTELKSFYWHLCDAIHVRGTAFSLQSMQPTFYSYNGVHTLSFSKEHLSQCLDDYILAVRHIAVCRAAENPILLIGLPIEQKYGINGPMSGFFEPHQANAFWKLLCDASVPFFRQLVETDQEVQAIKEGFASMPDISEEELQKQLDDFSANFKQNV